MWGVETTTTTTTTTTIGRRSGLDSGCPIYDYDYGASPSGSVQLERVRVVYMAYGHRPPPTIQKQTNTDLPLLEVAVDLILRH